MTQPTIMELFDIFENKESNNETKEIIEDEIITENVNIVLDEKSLVKQDEIVEVKYENEIYKMWKVKFIRPKITNFLKENHSNSLIVYELDNIDIVLFDNETFDIIPTEIQRTETFKSKYNKNYYVIDHSRFEDRIRRQIENNIKEYDKCWFFMDLEYLRYLQSGSLRKNISIDMSWFVDLIKKNKLKVFAIKYDGLVKELTTEDFKFIELTEDQKVLNRNKLKIYINVIRNLKFSDNEINNFYTIYDNENKQHNWKEEFKNNSGDNKRRELYGWTLYSMSDLSAINEILDMNSKIINYNYFRNIKRCLFYIGIFEVIEYRNNGYITTFIDKFDICKYFPGYIKNKKQWDGYKGNNLNHSTFTMIVNGSLKQHKTMLDF